jgi:hypothetical protein
VCFSALLSGITETENWFACRDFFIRAIDIGIFTKIALVSLSTDEVVVAEFQSDSAIGVSAVWPKDGDVTLDRCDAVTIAGVCCRASFFFVFGGDREFNAQPLMIERPNLELTGRDTRVIGGLDRDN